MTSLTQADTATETTNVVEVAGLTKTFGTFTAVDSVSFSIERHKIYGLLGRNGAGKTTLMQLMTGQDFATDGRVSVFGRGPVENADVLRRICFIKESQRYPENFKARHVFASAPWFFENWDADLAEDLTREFRVPLGREIKKLSRGQQSAVGVIVGLASRAPLTFFDEPYLGLDAVARQIFYDRLLEDYAEHPRTVILSTHLIDEVAQLLQHVIAIDDGRILFDRDADELRGSATAVAGPRAALDAFVASREVIRRDRLGGLASAVVNGRLSAEDRDAALATGLELSPVSLQQLIVNLTNTDQTAKEAR